MTPQDTILTQNLCTGYIKGGDRIVVTDNLNANLLSGEMTCLLGPNGAGKTTLLKTLAAMIPPLNGEIIIEGKKLQEYSELELARKIGIVLTDKISAPNLTVEQLVALGRNPYTGFFGKLSRIDKEIIDESIDMIGINNLRQRKVISLSDGERQKSLIAKTLAQQTPVIFLDEPTAFLDYPGKAEIMILLKRLAHNGDKTIFLSTHDLELALKIADKVWLLDKNRGIRIDTPENLSVNGEISNYFDRPGLKYDKDTMTFKVL